MMEELMAQTTSDEMALLRLSTMVELKALL